MMYSASTMMLPTSGVRTVWPNTPVDLGPVRSSRASRSARMRASWSSSNSAGMGWSFMVGSSRDGGFEGVEHRVLRDAERRPVDDDRHAVVAHRRFAAADGRVLVDRVAVDLER